MAKIFFILLVISQALSAQIQVTDDLGMPVALEHTAQRIISLSPHSAELLLAIGAAANMIGVAAFHDYPTQIQDLPVVSHFSGLDRERLIMLDPDLVVAWASGNKPNDIAWLKSMGIQVYLSEPTDLEDIPRSMLKLGQLTGHVETSIQAANQFRSDLDSACPNRLGLPVKLAYYEIWPSPPMTIGGRHWLNQVLEKASLRNVFVDQQRQILTITPEALLSRKVDLKISSFQPSQDLLPEVKLLSGSEQLARPGPRIVEGLRHLCSQL